MRLFQLPILAILLLLASNRLDAQPNGPQQPTPIGFTEVLLLGGSMLGLKKIKDHRKASNSADE